MEGQFGRRFARRGAWRLLAALACFPGAEGVAAQVPDTVSRDTVSFRLRELRIEALRPVASVSGASAVRLSLQAPRVAAVPLLEEALREIPFLQVRENSRGAHFREDFPEEGDLAASYFTTARLDGEGIDVETAPVEFSRVEPGETLIREEAETAAA